MKALSFLLLLGLSILPYSAFALLVDPKLRLECEQYRQNVVTGAVFDMNRYKAKLKRDDDAQLAAFLSIKNQFSDLFIIYLHTEPIGSQKYLGRITLVDYRDKNQVIAFIQPDLPFLLVKEQADWKVYMKCKVENDL